MDLDHSTAGFLRLCQPESLQELHVSLVEDVQLDQWHRFVNLHTLVIFDIRVPSVAPLLQCPSIVHLDLSECEELLEGQLIDLMRALPQLRTLNLEDTRGVTDDVLEQIARHQRGTLEVLYTPILDASHTSPGLNNILSQCSRLRTLSVEFPEDDDTNTSEGYDVWRAVQQHCKQLEHLRLVWFDREQNAGVENFIEAVSTLPNLRVISCPDTLHFRFEEITRAVRALRPDIRVCEYSVEY